MGEYNIASYRAWLAEEAGILPDEISDKALNYIVEQMELLRRNIYPEAKLIETIPSQDVMASYLLAIKERLNIDVAKSSPLYEMAGIFANREVLLRERVNDAGRAILKKLAEIQAKKPKPYGLERYFEEEAKTVAGVRAAYCVGVGNGLVRVSIVSTDPSGQATKELLDKVREHLRAPGKKLANDTIDVLGIASVGITLDVSLVAQPGCQIDTERLRTSFINDFESTNDVGRLIPRSWIISKLYPESVFDVRIRRISTFSSGIESEIVESIALKPDEWGYIKELRFE